MIKDRIALDWEPLIWPVKMKMLILPHKICKVFQFLEQDHKVHSYFKILGTMGMGWNTLQKEMLRDGFVCVCMRI
jgi:hypothetical protein